MHETQVHFLSFFLHIFTPSVLTSVNHHWKTKTKKYIGMRLLMALLYSSVEDDQTAERLCSEPTLRRHPFLVQLDFWGEHRLKSTSLITVWIVSSFAKDWSVSRYTGSVGSFVFSQWTLCSPRRCTITHFSAMCVWVRAGGGFGLKNNRKQKKNILHWHSDLALTAFGRYWTGAVDRCK